MASGRKSGKGSLGLLWLSTELLSIELRVLPGAGIRLFAPYKTEEFNGTARRLRKDKKSLRKIQSCPKTGSGRGWNTAFLLGQLHQRAWRLLSLSGKAMRLTQTAAEQIRHILRSKFGMKS
jgi:ribosomal protein S14